MKSSLSRRPARPLCDCHRRLGAQPPQIPGVQTSHVEIDRRHSEAATVELV
jgi:hypothetical protein